jgi:hypothetical protein
MRNEIPIACTLTNKELQERRKNVLSGLAENLIEVQELENGFSYRFPVKDAVLQDLANVIALERKCCPFLSFKLIVEAQNDFVSLELSGQEGTKEMIQKLFNWN